MSTWRPRMRVALFLINGQHNIMHGADRNFGQIKAVFYDFWFELNT